MDCHDKIDRVIEVALQRERDEAADANCDVCEGFYAHTECGGTREKPYRPNHCRFRAAIRGPEPHAEKGGEGEA